jgi:hypothetical protein
VLPGDGREDCTVLAVREPTGADELFVVETRLAPLPLFTELARRVATTAAGNPLDWTRLPATDLDAVALVIRRSWAGDAIRTDATCPGPDCRERIDVSFGIADYLEQHRPRRPRGVDVAPEPGWFTLAGAAVTFRIPTVADMLDAVSADGLYGRCVDAPELSLALDRRLARRLASRLDRALSALAPRLDDLVGGICPACGHEVTMRFEPLAYTLAELRNSFSAIHLETHALASAYGWPEEAILALPRSRRQRYASIIADGRAAA